MPAGTPPEKVLGAVRNFCCKEFALKHRYVMALHTDEPHPQAHVVIKAMGEQGQRLNIKKATLREWRRGFAKHLNDLGVEANATERTVRAVTGLRKRKLTEQELTRQRSGTVATGAGLGTAIPRDADHGP